MRYNLFKKSHNAFLSKGIALFLSMTLVLLSIPPTPLFAQDDPRDLMELVSQLTGVPLDEMNEEVNLPEPAQADTTLSFLGDQLQLSESDDDFEDEDEEVEEDEEEDQEDEEAEDEEGESQKPDHLQQHSEDHRQDGEHRQDEEHRPSEVEELEFENALAHLSPDFASAVIVKSLEAEDLESLVLLDIEVGIAIIRGKIVLFTSGSEHEIRVHPTVTEMLEDASLIAHSHPIGEISEPSFFDIDHAVEGVEYLISVDGIYAYNQSGLLSATPFDEDYLIEEIRRYHKPNASTVSTRGILNEFIKATDEFNADPLNSLIFRAASASPPADTTPPIGAFGIAGLPPSPPPVSDPVLSHTSPFRTTIQTNDADVRYARFLYTDDFNLRRADGFQVWTHSWNKDTRQWVLITNPFNQDGIPDSNIFVNETHSLALSGWLPIISGTTFYDLLKLMPDGDNSKAIAILFRDATGNITTLGDVSRNTTLHTRYEDQRKQIILRTTPTTSMTFVSATEDVTRFFSISGNDVGGDFLTRSIVDLPNNGTLSCSSSGTKSGTTTSWSCSYRGFLNFNGFDSFQYRVSDGFRTSLTRTVTVSVFAVPDNPVALNDFASVSEDSSVQIAVLSNDFDADGNSLTIGRVNGINVVNGSVVSVSNGTVTVEFSGTRLRFRPNTNYSGPASFTYNAKDSTGRLSATAATVSVTVFAVPDNPIANNDFASVNEDSSVQIAVLNNDFDADGNSLTIGRV